MTKQKRTKQNTREKSLLAVPFLLFQVFLTFIFTFMSFVLAQKLRKILVLCRKLPCVNPVLIICGKREPIPAEEHLCSDCDACKTINASRGSRNGQAANGILRSRGVEDWALHGNWDAPRFRRGWPRGKIFRLSPSACKTLCNSHRSFARLLNQQHVLLTNLETKLLAICNGHRPKRRKP